MLHPRLGVRKLKYLLGNNTIHTGRDRLFRLLKKHRLLVANRRAYHRTTDSHHRFHCHPNRIKEWVLLHRPAQLWVADITYLATRSGNAYLSLVTDAYSRKIVDHHIDTNMKASTVKKAFVNALKERKRSDELIHHSDRGLQYCSGEYQALHKKMEYLMNKPCNLSEARKMVAESVRLYI
ncbi:transposase (fragment) [Vibrio coralliirubri]